MKTKVICMGAHVQLSPKLEDRWVRYQFRQDPDHLPKEAAGGVVLESAIVVYGQVDEFQPGKAYEIEVSITKGA